MPTLKSVFGVARAVVPIGYCGYLVYYFLNVSGSVEQAWNIGLGPTVLGLGVVALLFTIPLIFKVMRIIGGPRWPGSAPRPNPPPGHGNDDDDDEAERTARAAAADAAIARYLASKPKEAAAVRPTPQSSGPARRPSFGRKNG